jgi:hypothetical protein
MRTHLSSRKHMLRRMQLSSLAVLLVSSVAHGHAGPRTHTYRELISGSAAPSGFDVNGDGVKGHSVTFAGLSIFGPVNGGILVEYDFANLRPDSACPAGTLRLPILASAGNRALTGTHGQLFMRDDAATGLVCLNLATGAFTMSLKGEFIGGMGRFAGATGTYEYKGSGTVLLLDNAGMPFGGFTLETVGRVTLPQ